MPTPCDACTAVRHTGEGRVTIAFTLAEMVPMVFQNDGPVRERILIAIGLIDRDEEKNLRDEIAGPIS